MNHLTDQQLLQEFAEHRSDAAFAEIVRRHVDLVYSAALRMVRDAHLAKDVTQSAFVALARNARQLTGRPVLSGWLHRTARNLAANVVRADVRRRTREQEAAAMNELQTTGPETAWDQIASHLDAALGELNEADRDAVLLRYFENKSASEMAGILGISDDAAQKRVSRAVDRLREFFSKRKVTIGASGLAVLISANAVQSAPVGLAATICASALAATTAATSATLTATKMIAMTTFQKSVIGTALIAAIGAGIVEWHQTAQLRQQNQALEQQQSVFAGQIRQWQREREEAVKRLTMLEAENERLKSNSNETELLKLRAEVTRLQGDATDSTGAAARAWLERVNQLRQWSEQSPAATIPEFEFLTQQDWLNAARGDLKTDDDYRRAMSLLRAAAENKFAPLAQSALAKYLQANNNQNPTEMAQLQPYFDPPVDDTLLQRWEVVPAKDIPSVGVGDPIITEKVAVDDLLDSRMVIGSRGYGTTDFLGSEIGEILKPVYQAYHQVHGESWAGFQVSDLMHYAETHEQQAAVQKLITQKQLRSAP